MRRPPPGRAMTFPEWSAAIVAGVRRFIPAKSAHPLEKVKNPIGSAKSRLLAQRVDAWKTLTYRTCSHY